MKKILLLFISFFLLVGTSSAATLFYDEIINGTYTYENDGTSAEMIMTFDTIYRPYDSDTKEYYPNGTYGAGTPITWELVLNFTDWVKPGGEVPGAWEETWASGWRVGLFESFYYVQTGTNDIGQNTGDYFGTIVDVEYGNPYPYLAPEGPWYIFGDLTRTQYSSTNGVYTSNGTIGGFVTNAPVPEPATMMLFGIGLLGLAGVSRRKK